MDVDVVVIGSGAAGLTAAVVAAQAGLKVLVTEKAEVYGGTTAYSLGAPWIVNNHHQKELGLEDSSADGDRYLRHTLGNLYDENRVAAFIESGAEMISYMEANSDARWKGVPMPDYFPEEEGARFGRTMLTCEYDGRRLGPYLQQLRLPLRGFAVFKSMQVDYLEVAKLQTTFKSRASFAFTVGKLLAYARDILRFGRGSHLANGNALVGMLLRSAIDANVELWRSSPAVKLLADGNAVSGVVIEHEGKQVAVHARRGVVLASGGFGASPELRAKYIPYPTEHVSVSPPENVGDGVRIGQEAGGALGAVNPDNAVWAPVSVLRRKNGKTDNYPHFGPDRGKPGSIIVDRQGKRFVDEATPYQIFVDAMHAKGVTTAHFIGDRKFLRSYGMGFAFPAPYPINSFIRNGYLIEAPSIAALAQKLGIEPRVLGNTVEEFNKHAREGKDPVFHRGENIYDNSQGDFNHKPNPNLGPLENGPYYAVTLHPGDVGTVLGMDTDENAQVRSVGGGLIRGLYAVGLDQNTVFRGVYPGGGSGIGPGMTFGYRAARHMASCCAATAIDSEVRSEVHQR